MLSLRRALALTLSTSLILSPCATSLAQGKPDTDKAADTKGPSTDKKPTPPRKITGADKRKAKASFEHGVERQKAEDYAAALDDFQQANQLIPTAQAQYRIGFLLDKLGKNAEAVEAYKAFLDFPPPEKMAEQKTAAEARLKILAVGRVRITSSPAGAIVTVDGKEAPNATPLGLLLRPGDHRIEFALAGHDPETQTLTVKGGTEVEVNVTLKETPPPPPPPPPPVASSAPAASSSAPPEAAPPVPEPVQTKVPAYITLGLAGVGALVGVGFGLKALSAKSDFNKVPTSSKADDAERNSLLADMAFGVAITLGITGTVLLLTNGKKDEPVKSGQFRFSPILTPHTQGAAAVLHF
jgi:hypothetical protein